MKGGAPLAPRRAEISRRTVYERADGRWIPVRRDFVIRGQVYEQSKGKVLEIAGWRLPRLPRADEQRLRALLSRKAWRYPKPWTERAPLAVEMVETGLPPELTPEWREQLDEKLRSDPIALAGPQIDLVSDAIYEALCRFTAERAQDYDRADVAREQRERRRRAKRLWQLGEHLQRAGALLGQLSADERCRLAKRVGTAELLQLEDHVADYALLARSAALSYFPDEVQAGAWQAGELPTVAAHAPSSDGHEALAARWLVYRLFLICKHLGAERLEKVITGCARAWPMGELVQEVFRPLGGGGESYLRDLLYPTRRTRGRKNTG